MKKLLLFFTAILLFSCNNNSNNMIVNGKIKEFQKGKVYLEKMIDTVLVKVDSVSLNASNEFSLSDNVDSPQLYFYFKI